MANTALIGLTLPVQGTLSGQWGDTVNNAISEIIDVAVAGTQTISTDADVNLAVTTGTYASTGLTSTSSQYAVLLCTGARTAARNINTPKQSKTYVVINDTTGGFAVTVRGGPTSPTTGITVAAGARAIIAWNGSDFVNVGGGVAAGSNTQVQFNNAGAFGASSSLTWSGTVLGTTGFTASSDSTFTSTGALQISKGTTGQQPGTPATGMLRYNTTTNQFEGYSGSSPAWNSVGGATISNDTSTATNVYPLFANATSGTATTLFTGDAKLLYKPSTGELASSVINASNGIVVNSLTVAVSYTIAAGTSGMSSGPITVASGQSVTVSSGSRWVVL
jgi:hypothetical protein